MPGFTGKYFIMGMASGVLPSASSSVLSCVSLFSCLPNRKVAVVESWAKLKKI